MLWDILWLSKTSWLFALNSATYARSIDKHKSVGAFVNEIASGLPAHLGYIWMAVKALATG